MGLQNIFHYNVLNGFDKARYLNGTSDYIDTNVVFSPSGDYEVSGWIKTSSTAAQFVFDARDGVSDGIILNILATTGLLSFSHNSTTISSTLVVNDGNLYRFVASKSGSNLSLQIYDSSGVLNEAEIIGSDATAISVTTAAYIGSRNFSTPVNFYDGQIFNLTAIDGTTTVIDTTDDSGFTYNGTSEVKLPSGALPSGVTASNPSGKWHNGAETYVNTNPLADPEMIYRSNIEADHEMRPDESFVVSEFMNNQDLDKAKDYAVYDKNITAEQIREVDEAIKYAWTPEELTDKVVWLEKNAYGEPVNTWNDRSGSWSEVGLRGTTAGWQSTVNSGVSLEGYDDWYECIPNTGNSRHGCAALNVYSGIQRVGYDFDFYIPSGGQIDRLGLCVVYNGIQRVETVSTKDEVVHVSFRDTEVAASGDPDIFITAIDTNGDQIYIGDGVSKFYIRNTIQHEFIGNDFYQTSGSAKPTLNADGKTLEFDGVADYLQCPVDSSNWQDLTYYEHWGVYYADGSNKYIAFNDEGGANRVRLYLNTSNQPNIFVVDGSSFQYRADAVTAGYHLIGFIFTGSEFKIYVDNIDQTLTPIAGTNNGKFIGDLVNKNSFDVAGIGIDNIASSIYATNKERFQLGLSSPTTEAQRTELFNYVKKQGYLDS